MILAWSWKGHYWTTQNVEIKRISKRPIIIIYIDAFLQKYWDSYITFQGKFSYHQQRIDRKKIISDMTGTLLINLKNSLPFKKLNHTVEFYLYSSIIIVSVKRLREVGINAVNLFSKALLRNRWYVNKLIYVDRSAVDPCCLYIMILLQANASNLSNTFEIVNWLKNL